MNPHRILLILGLNHLLADRHVSLWDEADVGGHAFADLAGRRSVVLWNGIGWGEVRLSVWWDYDHANHPQAELSGASRETFVTSRPLARRALYPRFVGATVSGWVERRTGRHLQGKGREGLFDIYTRKGNVEALRGIGMPACFGFKPEGPFFI